MEFIGDGLTFDDILLMPQYSEILPHEADLTTYLTNDIKLNISTNECWNGYCY